MDSLRAKAVAEREREREKMGTILEAKISDKQTN